MPAVTVLMPVFNGARYLRAAIDSVLTQTFTDFELLIVNDGSTDGTRAAIQSYSDPRIRAIHHDRNLGLPTALNHGLEAAASALIARQDADDLSAPARLARQVSFFGRHPDVALVGSQASVIDAEGRPLEPSARCLDELSIRWYALFDNPFIHSSVMFRRQVVWQECGGFDRSFSEDWVLWVRIMRDHQVANLPERLVTYRLHSASIIGAIDDRSADGASRARFETGVHDLVSRQILDAFSADGIAREDATLMSRFILGVPATDLGRFLSVFRRLLHLYQQRHPESRASSDFRRTLARQFDAIAYRITGGGRADVASVYRAALTEDPALWRELSWARVLALLLFGRDGRARLGTSAPARALRAIRQSHHG